jgi:hypothetical protein
MTQHLNRSEFSALRHQSDAAQTYLFARGNLWRAGFYDDAAARAMMELRAIEQQHAAALASAKARQLLNIR